MVVNILEHNVSHGLRCINLTNAMVDVAHSVRNEEYRYLWDNVLKVIGHWNGS